MDQDIRNSDLLPLVRSKVREGLTSSGAFRKLPKAQQRDIANNTVKALHYIVGGADGKSRPSAVTLAGRTPLAGALAGRRRQAPQTAGGRFAGAGGAVAAEAGSDAFTDMISKVDFPEFVSGLIDGVFNAIVTSSIKQMEAYGELVANVSKSVDQYMADNVTENNARDYLADRYPEHFEIDLDGDDPKLKMREGSDPDSLPDLQQEVGTEKPVKSLDNQTLERDVVPAARRRIAMDRQQLLATMVMMGVNRLVVTDGRIEASVLFELDTEDEVRRKRGRKTTADFERIRAGESGGKGSRSRSSSGFLGLGEKKRDRSSWFRKDRYQDTSNFKASTTKSEDSEAKVQMHAQLAGKVNVNFKSDYFPMERMVDVFQINQIRDKTPAQRASA